MKELEDKDLPPMTVIDKVVRFKETMWLIEKASDLEIGMAGISMARATGSVGDTQVHQNAGAPFGDGKILKYAKVSRIEFVKPS
jgi:hypothetical protein